VYLEPHVVRLRPRSDGAQKLCRYELNIDPQPAGCADCLDQDGNVVTQVWFRETTGCLRVESRFEAEMLRENPFDFRLPAEKVWGVPFVYSEPWTALLAAYANGVAIAPSVAAFARKGAGAAEGRTLSFLALLNQRLFEGREHGSPHHHAGRRPATAPDRDAGTEPHLGFRTHK